MEHILLDIISVAAVLLPTTLLIFFIPVNLYLKTNTKKAIRAHLTDPSVEFINKSPKLLKIILHKDENGRRCILSRFFFSYQKSGKPAHGQALFRNKELLDLKLYPENYRDPKGKFPMLSANDEQVTNTLSPPTNVVPFPGLD